MDASRIIKNIYLITPDWDDTDTLLAKTEMALAAGVKLLQYRNKIANADLKLQQATALKALCDQYQAQFMINDDYQLCRKIDADGVHLGKDDSIIEEVRNFLGQDKIIGVSCYNDLDRVRDMLNQSCDYIALGACYPTQTKPNAPRASVEFIKTVLSLSQKPVVAIGGITLDNCEPIINTGVASIAMIKCVYQAPDISNTIKTLKAKF
jgi:thiamine-phosphate pyrophosphorylase